MQFVDSHSYFAESYLQFRLRQRINFNTIARGNVFEVVSVLVYTFFCWYNIMAIFVFNY